MKYHIAGQTNRKYIYPLFLLLITLLSISCASIHNASQNKSGYGSIEGEIISCVPGFDEMAAALTLQKYSDSLSDRNSPDRYEYDTAVAPRKIESDSIGHIHADNIIPGLYMGIARGAPYNRIDDGGIIKAEMLARESCGPVRIILIRIGRDSVTSFEIQLPRTIQDWSNDPNYFQETVKWEGEIESILK